VFNFSVFGFYLASLLFSSQSKLGWVTKHRDSVGSLQVFSRQRHFLFTTKSIKHWRSILANSI